MTALIRCAAACGRELPAHELIETGGVLVCDPCHDAITRQAEKRDSIDDAWRAVESVAGWTVIRLDWNGLDERSAWTAAAARSVDDLPVRASSSSPARALRLLSRALADRAMATVT